MAPTLPSDRPQGKAFENLFDLLDRAGYNVEEQVLGLDPLEAHNVDLEVIEDEVLGTRGLSP